MRSFHLVKWLRDLAISRAAIFRWSKKIAAKKERNKPSQKIDQEALKRDIEEYPDSYSHERAERLGVSASGIRYAKKLLGVSYKKKLESSQSRSRKKIYVLPRNRQVKK